MDFSRLDIGSKRIIKTVKLDKKMISVGNCETSDIFIETNNSKVIPKTVFTIKYTCDRYILQKRVKTGDLTIGIDAVLEEPKDVLPNVVITLVIHEEKFQFKLHKPKKMKLQELNKNEKNTKAKNILRKTKVVTQNEQLPVVRTFHDEVIESLICPICTMLLKTPLTLCCGHSFCRNCIITAFRTSGRNCPTCRHRLTAVDIKSKPSIALIQFINSMKSDEKFKEILTNRALIDNEKDLPNEFPDDDNANNFEAGYNSPEDRRNSRSFETHEVDSNCNCSYCRRDNNIHLSDDDTFSDEQENYCSEHHCYH